MCVIVSSVFLPSTRRVFRGHDLIVFRHISSSERLFMRKGNDGTYEPRFMWDMIGGSGPIGMRVPHDAMETDNGWKLTSGISQGFTAHFLTCDGIHGDM